MAPSCLAPSPRKVTFARTRAVAHVAANSDVALAKSARSADEFPP